MVAYGSSDMNTNRGNLFGYAPVLGVAMIGLATTTSQRTFAKPVAYVSVIGGEGGIHVESEDEISASLLAGREAKVDGRISRKRLIASVDLGESVTTLADGSLSLFLPGHDAVIFLESDSTVRFEELPGETVGVEFRIVLTAGQARVVQRTSAASWIVLAAEVNGELQGQSITRGSTLSATIGDNDATFTALRGSLTYLHGALGKGPLVNGQGQLIVQGGISVSEGQSISTSANAQPASDKGAGASLPESWDQRTLQFAMDESGAWLAEAEKGDFTPVRSPGRGSPEILDEQTETALAFDQPRPVLASPSARVVGSAIRGTLGPAQTLLESTSPGSVIAGTRFRRSRIIGNPGTTGTGALKVNRSAELLIRLSGS